MSLRETDKVPIPFKYSDLRWVWVGIGRDASFIAPSFSLSNVSDSTSTGANKRPKNGLGLKGGPLMLYAARVG